MYKIYRHKRLQKNIIILEELNLNSIAYDIEEQKIFLLPYSKYRINNKVYSKNKKLVYKLEEDIEDIDIYEIKSYIKGGFKTRTKEANDYTSPRDNIIIYAYDDLYAYVRYINNDKPLEESFGKIKIETIDNYLLLNLEFIDEL